MPLGGIALSGVSGAAGVTPEGRAMLDRLQSLTAEYPVTPVVAVEVNVAGHDRQLLLKLEGR